jgi:hypothetical protein
VVAALLAGCGGGRALDVPDAGAEGTELGADHGVTADAPPGGAVELQPVPPSTPPRGQPLVDFASRVGGSGVGYDLCVSGAVTRGSRCDTCAPPPGGGEYLVFSGGGPGDGDGQRAQAYIYSLDGPLAIGGSGLWFDLSLQAGNAEHTRLVLFSVGTDCSTRGQLGAYDLVDVLSTPEIWAQTCVSLPAAALDGLGFRFDGAVIGLDSFRLGPACP